jgi:hypothetical protein
LVGFAALRDRWQEKRRRRSAKLAAFDENFLFEHQYVGEMSEKFGLS